jgi:hypothetical protein
MQPALFHPVVDCAPAHAELTQLSAADHAVLALGERGDPPIQAFRSDLTPYVGVNRIYFGREVGRGVGRGVGHGLRFAPEVKRVAARA